MNTKGVRISVPLFLRKVSLYGTNRPQSIFDPGVIDFDASALNGEFGNVVGLYKSAMKTREKNLLKKGITT